MLRYSRFGIAGAMLHLAILGYTVTLILGKGEPSWPNYWMIFLALDFPVSLGVMPVNWLVPPSGGGPLRDLTNFWWPLLYHGLVGTGWWYIVGWAIERKVWRREEGGDHGQERPDGTGPERQDR
jgi:hypothetical protein